MPSGINRLVLKSPLVPFAVIVLATAASAAVAYGTNADLAAYRHGLEIIMNVRRLQWLLAAAAVVLSLGLIGLVVSGRHRVFWLVGLAPVLGLFFVRFGPQTDAFRVIENPVYLAADEVSTLEPDEWVVGVVHDEESYAFPYAVLYGNPMVVQTTRDKKLAVIWSPFANVARVFLLDRDVRARDFDVVGMPVNATLLYNAKFGEFINGITGLNQRTGAAPTGFSPPIASVQTTWATWKKSHPTTKMMLPGERTTKLPPGRPLLPRYPIPGEPAATSALPVVIIHGEQPIALPRDEVKRLQNLSAGKMPVLVVRDANDVTAFSRIVQDDLRPRFMPNSDMKRKNVVYVDSDTNTGWSINGYAIDGDFMKEHAHLQRLRVDGATYWGVMKYWYPSLKMLRE